MQIAALFITQLIINFDQIVIFEFTRKESCPPPCLVGHELLDSGISQNKLEN